MFQTTEVKVGAISFDVRYVWKGHQVRFAIGCFVSHCSKINGRPPPSDSNALYHKSMVFAGVSSRGPHPSTFVPSNPVANSALISSAMHGRVS